MLGSLHMIFLCRANTRIKPNCAAQATAWQAFIATPLLERSSFGLNELLGLRIWPQPGRRKHVPLRTKREPD